MIRLQSLAANQGQRTALHTEYQRFSHIQDNEPVPQTEFYKQTRLVMQHTTGDLTPMTVTPTIAGIDVYLAAIGIAVVVILVAGLAVLLRRRKKTAEKEEP